MYIYTHIFPIGYWLFPIGYWLFSIPSAVRAAAAPAPLPPDPRDPEASSGRTGPFWATSLGLLF